MRGDECFQLKGPFFKLFSVGNDDQHSIDGANSAWLYFIRLFVYRKCSNPVNYLKQQLLMTLQEVLLDDGRPFCSHYGAVVGLTELGPEVKSDCLHSQFCIFLLWLSRVITKLQRPHPFFMWRTLKVCRECKLASQDLISLIIMKSRHQLAWRIRRLISTITRKIENCKHSNSDF